MIIIEHGAYACTPEQEEFKDSEVSEASRRYLGLKNYCKTLGKVRGYYVKVWLTEGTPPEIKFEVEHR